MATLSPITPNNTTPNPITHITPVPVIPIFFVLLLLLLLLRLLLLLLLLLGVSRCSQVHPGTMVALQ